MRLPTLAACLCLLAPPALADCADVPGACEVALGSYHITLPVDGGDTMPAVIFLHGAGGSGMGTMRNTAMSGTILSRGYALIAPDGMGRDGRRGGGWSFHPGRPEQRDERTFLTQVAGDAAARFGIDRDRILLSGFSIGGSMTSYIACAAPDAFAAFAPVAGSFWRPRPTGCAGPVRLLHTHGWRDTTVPLEGRPLRNGALIQGDVWHAMEIWRTANGCDLMRPDTFEDLAGFWIRAWTTCTPGSALAFALHPGAHGVPPGWAGLALDWFEEQVPPPG